MHTSIAYLPEISPRYRHQHSLTTSVEQSYSFKQHMAHTRQVYSDTYCDVQSGVVKQKRLKNHRRALQEQYAQQLSPNIKGLNLLGRAVAPKEIYFTLRNNPIVTIEPEPIIVKQVITDQSLALSNTVVDKDLDLPKIKSKPQKRTKRGQSAAPIKPARSLSKLRSPSPPIPEEVVPKDVLTPNEPAPKLPVVRTVKKQPDEYKLAQEKRLEKMVKLYEAKEQARIYQLMNRGSQKLKYFVSPGNNSQVIKKCMLLRSDRWEETNSFDKLYNFKWQPWARGIPFNAVSAQGTKQLVNHLPNHYLLTTKHQLFESMAVYCESIGVNVFNFVPLTFLLQTQSHYCITEFQKFLAFYHNGQQVSLPQCLKIQNQVSQYVCPKAHSQGRNVWILKATGFNRGVGIHVFNKIEHLKQILQEYADSSIGCNGEVDQLRQCIQATKTQEPQGVKQEGQSLRSANFIIQKYLESPLLINERKFDIRVWVLVSHSAVYVFQQGYIRTSSTPFTLDQDSILKPEVHLTNNAIQSQFEGYGKYESGNQLSFDQFQKYLDQTNGKQGFVQNQMIPDIHNQITISMKSVKLQTGKAFFEIFGYDFIIDTDYNTWLIEVNTNPCLEESSPLLQQLIPRMVNDALKLTLDQQFVPKKGQSDVKNINAFAVDGTDINENLWTQLMSLPITQEKSKEHKRIPFI